MSVKQYPTSFKAISAETLTAFADIPSAVASDCMPQVQTMHSGINPLDRSMKLVGQARTAECSVGENSAVRAAIGVCEVGQVIVVDAQGYTDTAVFGGLMAIYAKERGVAGLVIDGAVRDSEEIIDADLPMFARGTTPRAPRKTALGYIDGTVCVGGISVTAGDLIIGDADGVTVVPYAQIDECLANAREILRKEADVMETLKQGGTMAGIYGKVDVEPI